MQIKPYATLVFLASLLLCGAAVAQGQWKWRDAEGRITVSDLPPPRGVADKDILQRPEAPKPRPARAEPASGTASAAAPDGTAAAGKPADKGADKAADKELEAKKRAADAERAAKAKAEEQKAAAQRADNCQRARQQIATLESGQRIARVNAQGEREFLDDAQRAAEARRAREIAASECR